jgi:hypothetical protein
MKVSLPALFWLVPTFEAIHNAEEALSMSAFGQTHGTPFPLSNAEAWVATQAVTLIVLALTAWVLHKPRPNRWYQWLLVMDGAILVNALGHVVISLTLGTLSPGTISAVLLNLPLAILLFRHCLRAAVITPRGSALAILTGAVLQFPLIAAFLAVGKLMA